MGRNIALLALIGVAGCVPPGARPMPEAPVASGPAPNPRLDLDLTGLTDPPPWDIRPVAPSATVVAEQVYAARRGDTLSSIAAKTGSGAGAIASANALAPPFTLTAGQALKIPGGRYHQVRSGDTGIAIARAYTTPWREIIAANGLAEPFVLRVGQRLLVPRGTGPQPSAEQRIAARAAAFRIDIDDIVTGGEPARTAQAPVRRVPAFANAGTLSPARFAWPADGRVVGRFGPQGSGRVSQGIDISVPEGAPIFAASAGTVAYVGSAVPGYGGLILIRHDGNWFTAYGHAGAASVKKGDAVKGGQAIGAAGSDAPIHFEVRRARQPVDPLTYLPKR